jgi:hypothetical protein
MPKGASQVNIENQEAYDEILAAEVPERVQREVTRLIDSVPYTTCVLVAIGEWLARVGDDEGADLIREFAMKTYAVHEANTV